MKRMRSLGKAYESALSTPTVISTSFAGKAPIEEVIELNSGLAQGKSVARAFTLMVLIIDFTMNNHRFPSELKDMEPYRRLL